MGETRLNTNTGNDLGGIVLAGGESSRMGTDKAALLFRSKPLIEYPLDLLKRYCSEIFISCDKDKFPSYDFRKIPDDIQGKGPLSGIYSCLKASHKPRVIVLGCDMPFLSVKLMDHLICHSEGYDMALPFHGGHYEPLCGLYSRELLPVIEKMFSKGDFSPLSLIPEVKFNKLILSDSDSGYNHKLFYNINSPADLDIPW